MRRPPLSRLAESFRRDALEILARRDRPIARGHVKNGRVVLQPLARGFRLDVIGTDENGKEQRLATTHYEHLPWAQHIARSIAENLCVQLEDLTSGDGA